MNLKHVLNLTHNMLTFYIENDINNLEKAIIFLVKNNKICYFKIANYKYC